jgi:aryl-alcohol dehydrogenase-like predicted oxidoreductase
MMNFSKIMLGTVQFGLNYGIANTDGKPSYEKSRDIVATAYENGISSFDTAAAYGDSEEVLGHIFAELKIKDKVNVVSKVAPLIEHKLSRYEVEKRINESVETSLKRLGIEQLAVCLFHREEDFEYIDIIRKLETQGLIAGSGVSLDSAEYCKEVLDNNIKFLQVPYNILDKRFDSFWPKAEAAGITIFTRSVYLQGLLLMPEANIIPHLQKVIPIRRELEKLAATSNMDMAELCMRYVLCNSAITSVLTGVDSNEQLKQNVELFNKGPLPGEILNKVKKIVPFLPEELIRPILWPK